MANGEMPGALGIAFFLKQWGTYWSNPLVQED
jgi:hypothetical protein